MFYAKAGKSSCAGNAPPYRAERTQPKDKRGQISFNLIDGCTNAVQREVVYSTYNKPALEITGEKPR